MAAAAVEAQHYQEVVDAYEQAFFYESGPYQEHLLREIALHLRLAPDSRLADVGGGTGNFTAALAKAAGLIRPALCVDFSADMLKLAAAQPGVEARPRGRCPSPPPPPATTLLSRSYAHPFAGPLVPARPAPVPRRRRRRHRMTQTMCLDALAFSALPDERYDRLLLKEIVHHIAPADVPAMYAGFHRQLRTGGVAVTATRPQEVDYPLFEAARQARRRRRRRRRRRSVAATRMRDRPQVWRDNQPPATLYLGAMASAGFRIEAREATYEATIPKQRWFAMARRPAAPPRLRRAAAAPPLWPESAACGDPLGQVRSRFWSTFSHFSDAELEVRARFGHGGGGGAQAAHRPALKRLPRRAWRRRGFARWTRVTKETP